MAISSLNDGSQTIGTAEYSMVANTTASVPLSNTDDGFYQVFVDLSNLAAGDQFQVKLYEKVYNGSQGVAEVWTFTGVQAKPIFITPGVLLVEGWDCTIKKIAGTDRTIYFSIRRVT